MLQPINKYSVILLFSLIASRALSVHLPFAYGQTNADADSATEGGSSTARTLAHRFADQFSTQE